MFARIAIVTSDVFVRRLTPALTAFVKEKRDFRVIDIRHPLPELRRIIRSCRPSGIITEYLPRITEAIVALGLPTVISATDEIFPGAVSLDVNDREVGAVAAKFLLESGHQNFGCVYLGTPYASQRLAGFKARVKSSGKIVASFLHPGRQSLNYMESWRDEDLSLVQWLKNLPKPAGIFAVHDPLGRSVCDAAAQAGLRIPDDIAVVGANNDEIVCGLSYPPLSSVTIPWDRIGALVGKWTQRLVDGRPAPKSPILVSPGPVIARQSTALVAVDDSDLRRLLHHFREQAGHPITIRSACSVLRLSRRSIERKCAIVLNSSPWEILCRIRTESAKRLLQETDLPMAIIADRSGFPSPERFSVVFRRQTKLSPTAYRRKVRGTPA